MKKIPLFLVFKSAASIYVAKMFYDIKYHPDTVANPNNITIVSLSALVAGFAIYGIICAIAAVRVGRTADGIEREVKKNIDNAFNPQKDNAVDKL